MYSARVPTIKNNNHILSTDVKKTGIFHVIFPNPIHA